MFDLVMLSKKELEDVKAGAAIIRVGGRSCGCACAQDSVGPNGEWIEVNHTSNINFNYEAPGQDGWGAWSPEMWHLRKPPVYNCDGTPMYP